MNRVRAGRIVGFGSAFGFALALALLLPRPMTAADAGVRRDGTAVTQDSVPVLRREGQAHRLSGSAPQIDGRLDEAIWDDAVPLDGFTQIAPRTGAPASLETEIRILYDDQALYIGARMHDPAPDSIVGLLTRRDEFSASDWILVSIDSYHDRRTSYDFALNPRGVQADGHRYNDTNDDSRWNAVWDGAAEVHAEGWTAEFRIPFSQLRFTETPGETTWGFNALRVIGRTREESGWSPVVPNSGSVVSSAGTLRGLRGITAGKRLEVAPYLSAQAGPRAGISGREGRPLTGRDAAIGADLQMAVLGNLTVNVTLNPDFGQVEADPGQVNLSAFETFLPERRPFFLEGGSIFRIPLAAGNGGSESLFYSRRIGRSPRGEPEDRGGWVETPIQTRILGAWKLSGRTDGGRSIGILHSITARERATIHPETGDPFAETVEPRTHQVVARTIQDLREGESAIGLVTTGVWRDRGDADLLEIHRDAFTLGIDGRHRWGGGRYQATGAILGSLVRGSEDALIATQRSAARYFQRPDADHLGVDSTRTSLGGWSGIWRIEKMTGTFRAATGGEVRSPGFEVNDLGYMQSAGELFPWIWLGYSNTTPGTLFRRRFINVNAWSGHTFGGESSNRGANINGSATFLNEWTVNAGLSIDLESDSPSLLRGGPLFRREGAWGAWGGLSSDSRRPFQAGANFNVSERPESDTHLRSYTVNLRWRPSSSITVSATPSFASEQIDRQWVTRRTTGEGAEARDHYIMGRIDQRTLRLTTRLDMAFTPTLTLQLYAEPFLSSAEYTRFREVTDPLASRYEDRFSPIEARVDGDDVFADLNGDGHEERWDNPDFGRRQFRSNAVLRWEFRPGSALFLVWSQARDHRSDDGHFRAGDDLGTLFGRRPENLFMVKASYWFTP